MLLDTLPPREHPLNHAHFYPVASTPSRVLRHLYTRIARPLCIYGASSCRVSCFARQHGRPTHCIPCCSPGVPPYDVLSSTSLSLTESYIKSNIKSNTKSLVLSLVFSPLESRVAIDHPHRVPFGAKRLMCCLAIITFLAILSLLRPFSTPFRFLCRSCPKICMRPVHRLASFPIDEVLPKAQYLSCGLPHTDVSFGALMEVCERVCYLCESCGSVIMAFYSNISQSVDYAFMYALAGEEPKRECNVNFSSIHNSRMTLGVPTLCSHPSAPPSSWLLL